ncbi:SRPBCC family protein [Salinimicrobium gaetbulicola]|uniref:GyrI-like domain-containing protein n=1 Tax=Salinimicrobium gaetbulicola TaxID=999702 RepID=A0ABW3IID5_9FLAO
MKIIKYLFFLFLIVFIAGSIYVATKDGDYSVESSKVINAPAPLLFKEVADLSNWKSWNAWDEQKEINMDVSEEPTGEGAEFSWTADEIRDGKITTLSTIPYSKIEQSLVLETSTGEATGKIIWSFEAVDEQTRVTWQMSGSQSFKEKLAFTIQEKDFTEIFQPIFEQGLQNLEENVIRRMEEYSINVDGITEHGGGYYMYTTTAAKLGEVNARASKMISQVSVYMDDNNISISGKPFIIYNQRDERNNSSIFSAAVPTPSQVITPSGSPVLNGYLAPQKVVKTTLKGHNKNAAEAWEKTYRYIEENGLEVDPRGQAFEIFITNPLEVENPALWVTEIYIPVQ